MSYDPDRPNSYHARAVHDAAQEQQGRWRGNKEVSVTGASPLPLHAGVLVAPTWSHDPVPTEPPTGECIDWLPSLETVSGVDRAEALAIDAANRGEAPEDEAQ
jgi:hypothetical protein